MISHVDETPQQLLPVIQEFQQLIETTPRIYMYFVQMFDEASRRKPYVRESNVAARMRDHRHMLQVLNHILSQAPQWSDAEAGVGMIGVPMCAVFDYEMGTPRYVTQLEREYLMLMAMWLQRACSFFGPGCEPHDEEAAQRVGEVSPGEHAPYDIPCPW